VVFAKVLVDSSDSSPCTGTANESNGGMSHSALGIADGIVKILACDTGSAGSGRTARGAAITKLAGSVASGGVGG
jgi:hypothetical protein